MRKSRAHRPLRRPRQSDFGKAPSAARRKSNQRNRRRSPTRYGGTKGDNTLTKDEIVTAVRRILKSPDFEGALYGTGRQQARSARGDAAFDALLECAEADIKAAGEQLGQHDGAAG